LSELSTSPNSEPPNPYKGLKLASQLLCADACKFFGILMLVVIFLIDFIGKTTTGPIRWPWEPNDVGIAEGMKMFALPHWIRKIYVWYLR
jgi:hypothetical protein